MGRPPNHPSNDCCLIIRFGAPPCMETSMDIDNHSFTMSAKDFALFLYIDSKMVDITR